MSLCDEDEESFAETHLFGEQPAVPAGNLLPPPIPEELQKDGGEGKKEKKKKRRSKSRDTTDGAMHVNGDVPRGAGSVRAMGSRKQSVSSLLNTSQPLPPPPHHMRMMNGLWQDQNKRR